MDISSYTNYLKPLSQSFKIYQDRSFIKQVQLRDNIYIYKQISGISKSAPIKIACQNHEIPEGWEVSISGVRGMKELNTDDVYLVSVVSKDLIEINSINSTTYQDYSGGGTIKFIKPFNFAGFEPRLTILDSNGNFLNLSSKDILSSNDRTNTVDIILSPDTVSKCNNHRYRLDLVQLDIVLPVSSGPIIKSRS